MIRTKEEILKMFKNYLISRGIKESSTPVYINVIKHILDRYLKEKNLHGLDETEIVEIASEMYQDIPRYNLKSYKNIAPKAVRYFEDFAVFLNQLNLKAGGKAGRYEVVSNLLGTFEAEEVEYRDGLFLVKTTAGEKLMLPLHVITYVRERD